jgi:thiol-disulfide isomerase/thioredoxin
MKKFNILLALLWMSITVQAQGIHFESGSWKEVTTKAKKEKKLIYMDIYTTWCGPCKVMAAQIFPDIQAGRKYNDLFINYKIDAEKGEGIALAKKYEVEGYPTNLYVNPETEEVVYRVMGSTDLDNFLNRADIALLEQKDPMKWADYELKYEKGNREKTFLISYLNKAERLNKNNDKALDSYVEKFVPKTPDDSTLKFLLKHTNTLDNKSMPVLFAHKERLDKLNPEPVDFFTTWSSSKPYRTLEKAIENKDERLLAVIESGITRYDIKTGIPSGMYFFRKEFYNKTGNDEKGWMASAAEAEFLSNLSGQEYDLMNKEAMANIRSSIIYQLKGMNVPEDKFESSIEATLDKNPEMRKSATMNAAQSLNETAWKVFERKREDKDAVTMAVKWSAASLRMAEGTASWPLFADTYASLVYLQGNKAEAIAKEEEAIKKAEELNTEGIEGLKETLEKMKTGKL